MKHVIRIIAFAAITILVALVMVAFAGQAPPAPKYQPTEVQALRLKVAQQQAQLAQRDLQDAQVKFQRSLQDLRDEGERVKVEEKWPKEVVFDIGSLTFTAPQPPPATTPAKPAAKESKP